MFQSGSTPGQRPSKTTGSWAEAPIVRASTSACQLVTWWSPKATFSSTSCGGVLGSRVAVGAVEQSEEGVEVHRAVEQHRVVHRWDSQRGAGEVGRDGGQGTAEDPALAVAVVV